MVETIGPLTREQAIAEALEPLFVGEGDTRHRKKRRAMKEIMGVVSGLMLGRAESKWGDGFNREEALQSIQVLADWFEGNGEAAMAQTLNYCAGRPFDRSEMAEARKWMHTKLTHIVAQTCDCRGFDRNGGSGSCGACRTYSAMMSEFAGH